eukprot:158513_1
MLFILISLSLHVVLSDIEWFKQTEIHQQNILQLSNGWGDCIGWTPTSDIPTQIQLETIFNTVTTIRLAAIKNDVYNFTAQCITVQVPLNWDDESSTETIDYHLAHIFASDNVDNTNENGAFWMLNGGPGGDGQSLYPTSIPWLTYMEAQYDMYIPDHRGTGLSHPIQCPSNLLLANDLQGCINFMNNTYGNDIYHFSTYAASMDLGYTIDLFIDSLTLYIPDDTIIYGISYGTYYLNTYLNIFDNQATAVILDGICPPDLCRIIDYDNNANNVGINFVNKCGDDEFCRKQFDNNNPYESMQLLFNVLTTDQSCVTIELPITPVLKQVFFTLLTNFYNRILIPAVVYRMNRCNDNDKNALNYFFNIMLTTNVTTNMTITLGANILLSEMWNGLDSDDPGKDLSELLDEENGYYISSGISVNYRLWWDIWNRYPPNEQVYGQYANPSIPMLLLNGNLDPQTPDTWAIHSAEQYNANINDNMPNELNRYYYTFPNTPHFVMFRSPIINSTQESQITGDNLETCGFWIMKSFINRDNNWIPNDSCIDWIEKIDWSGSNNISKLLTMELFGTDDLWDIEQDTDDSDTALIWVIVIGLIIIIIEMALFSYCDYKKQLTPQDDIEPLLDTPKVAFSERY